MIQYQKRTLSNGLTAIVHKDDTTPLVAINILYKVGSRNEDPDKTGFTHLFEHLMFGGTKNVPNYDDPIQEAGGENNAFTNSDFTNFYLTLPLANVEVGLWLEADRMKGLNFTKKNLDTQKKVVIEEFKETCLNEPYGDMWHHIAEMAYQHHPYKWPTIGKDISHIEKADLDDVKSFFANYYRPNNAIIVLVGNITEEEGFQLIEKWFGSIPGAEIKFNPIEFDTLSSGFKRKEIHAAVPMKSVVLTFMMQSRIHPDFYVTDLLSDILSSGRSSRLYQKLVKEQQLFSHIDAFVTGSTDPGLLLVEGKVKDEVSIDVARKAIMDILQELCDNKIEERELQKIKNRAESHLVFSELGALNKAMSLAAFEHLGDIDLINKEIDIYQAITAEDMMRVSRELFRHENCCELVYIPKV